LLCTVYCFVLTIVVYRLFNSCVQAVVVYRLLFVVYRLLFVVYRLLLFTGWFRRCWSLCKDGT